MIYTTLLVMIDPYIMMLALYRQNKISADTLNQVAFQNVVSLKNSSGQTFSNWEKYPDSSIDPEEMRYNPKPNQWHGAAKAQESSQKISL
jgi:hypothetical protein